MEKRCPRSCFVPEWQPAIMCLQRQPRATTPSLGACSSSLAVYDPRDTDFFFFKVSYSWGGKKSDGDEAGDIQRSWYSLWT